MSPKELILAMKATGWTQADIAAATGIPQPTISKMERGAVKDVLLSNYRALEAAHAKRIAEANAAPVAAGG